MHTQYIQCSSTCRGGVRAREMTCVQPSFTPLTFELILDKDKNSILTTVSDSLCASGSMARPADTISCNDDIDCPVRWRGLPWGEVYTLLFFFLPLLLIDVHVSLLVRL